MKLWYTNNFPSLPSLLIATLEPHAFNIPMYIIIATCIERTTMLRANIMLVTCTGEGMLLLFRIVPGSFLKGKLF